MATNNLSNKFMQVLNEVPNFVTDETAQAGNRTYKYLNLATILKTIKPVSRSTVWHSASASRSTTREKRDRPSEQWKPSFR